MKIPHVKSWCVAALAAAAVSSVPAAHAAKLVELDATTLPVGAAATWANTGTLGGNFVSAGTTTPAVAAIAAGTGTVNAMSLVNTSFFAGPGAPPSLTTNSGARTIEVWAHNPTIEAEETLVAWSRRGGPNGSNWSFNYGNNAVYGALGGWGPWDVGWGTNPAAATWHHLVITYDFGTVRVYSDGVQTNIATPGGYYLHTVKADGVTPLPICVGGQNNNAAPYNPLVFNSGLNIAKVRVWDTTLTPTQIYNNYVAEAPTFQKATALPPKVLVFTGTPSAVMAGQPVTLTYEANLADSVSISDGTNVIYTASGAAAAKGTFVTSVTASTTYTITVTNTNGSVTTNTSVAPILTLGLAHRWSFNESNSGGAADTSCVDSVGASHGLSVGPQNGIIRGPYNATVGTATAWARVDETGVTAGTKGVRLGGGASTSSAYIDMPNAVMSGLSQVTFEGWMTLHGTVTWGRYFDFGNNGSGGVIAAEQTAPGGALSGIEYMAITSSIGGTATSRRITMKDNNVENLFDVTTEVGTYPNAFHFAAVYDPVGNAGVSPAFKYYKNGVLLGTLNTAFRPQDIDFRNNWLGRSNWNGDANTNATYNEFRIWGVPMTTGMITTSIANGPDGTPPALPLAIQALSAFPATVAPGQATKLSWIVLPGSGTPTLSMDNGVTISTPTNYFNYVTVNPAVTTTYTLTATDGANVVTKTVTVNVSAFAPVAQTDSATTGYQASVAAKLLATDADTAASGLTYSVVAGPANGALSGTAPNLMYSPNAGFSGTDTFTWKANDGVADSNVATFTINVNPAPAPVTAIALGNSSIRTDDGVGNFVGNLAATDANPDDTFTYTLVSGAGDTNNGYFTIVGNQLISNHDFSADLNQTVSIRVKATDSTGNTFEQVITKKVGAPDLHVKINEVHYNGPRNNVGSEFIELYNPFSTPVNVGGWAFTKGVQFTIPSGTQITGNGYLVIAQNPATLAALYPGVTALGPWTGGLSSDGDTIELRDATNTQVDQLDYGFNTPWPVPPNGDGPSLELMNPSLDNDIGGHWRSSTMAAAATNYVSAGSSWNYRPGTTEASSPVDDWRQNSFATDATWKTGTAPIGLFKINSNVSVATHVENGVTLGTQLTAATTGLASDMATYSAANTNVLTNFTTLYRSVFFRKSFTVTGTIPKSLYLRLMHNDAAIVWINGTEVARFGFDPAHATGEIPFNYAAPYERANDPWSDKALLNTDAYLVSGNNTITIQGWTANPVLRAAPENQDVAANYNIFDFSIDAVLGPLTEYGGTPGAQNSSFAANPPPAIRQVEHLPNAPRSNQAVLVTAKVSDRQGVGSVQLGYQVNAPGAFLSAVLPMGLDALGLNIVNNRNIDNAPNPAFEDPANWTMIPMVDDGTVAGDIAGDGIFSALLPAQVHRALVRYRVFATDLLGAAARAPSADDPSKNFAYYVYDAVPAYQAAAGTFGPAALTSLPVYQFVMRAEDFEAVNAYTAAQQNALGNSYDLNALLARRAYNYEGAMVYDGKVYDHTEVRIRGGNSRYNGVGKRHYRFRFPKGNAFQAKDNKGNPYPRGWEDLLFNKMFGNKGAYDFGLTYATGAKMWGNMGLPMPYNHWVHFRVVRAANEADPALGDFYGMYQALELPDGKNFLKSRDLPTGNFYKMSDWIQNAEMDERYQNATSVDYGEDFDNIRYNIHPQTSQSFMETNIDMPNWYSYRVIQEAIRHYDIFIEPTGRHRIKNLYWWFRPSSNPNGLGQLVQMPYDWDASFGPNFNNGNEVISNALSIQNSVYTATPVNFIDSPTYTAGGTLPSRTPMRIALRNRIREARDLMIYRDGTGRGPCDDIIDDALGTISSFYAADMARWPNNTGAVGHWAGGAPAKAQDMKNFLFVSWTDQFGADAAVPAGGRATFLDGISDNVAYNATTLDGDVGRLPAKPVITYAGTGGFPVDGLVFSTSAFSDPQGATDFAAYEYRIGEVAAPTATTDRIYEAVDVWRSSEISVAGTTSIQIPATTLRVGRTYRARVRHKDITGRFGHWSDPVQFTAAASNYVDTLYENLIVSEIMYKPSGLGATPGAAFEYVELRNISTTLTLNLDNVRITKGVNFDVPAGLTLAPGARILIVADPVSFSARYPSVPVAQILGPWDYPNSSLSNGGEELKISYGAGDPVHSIVYDDVAPWPIEGNITGYSIVYKGPKPAVGEVTDPQNVGPNWRGAYIIGGNPGGTDSPTLAEWMDGIGQTDPLADPDKDGYNNCLTFAFGHDIHPFSITATTHVDGGGLPYLAMDYTRRRGGAEGVTYTPEVSTDLGTWTGGLADIVTITDNGDGTETVRVRVSQSIQNGTRAFLKVNVTHE